MSLTININDLTLCHRGSGGITHNTLPDICKTPDKGIPKPFDNEAYSSDLANGTTSVFADGGNMIANFGSIFAKSTLDGGGLLGGIKSGTVLAEADFISHSFDVFFEGKAACRLSDKMWMNHRNTVNMGGLKQAPLEALPELMLICIHICICDKMPLKSQSGKSDLKQECVEKALIAEDDLLNGKSPIKAEMPYNMTTNPPSPLYSIKTLQDNNLLRASQYLPRRMKNEGLLAASQNGGVYQVRIPDAVITRTPQDLSGAALTAPNLKAVVEIKFDDPWNQGQLKDYAKIAGGADKVVELSPEECMCNLPPPAPVPEPKPVPVEEPGWIRRHIKEISEATGLTGAGLIAYLIISEGSRIIPVRNLIPAP